MINKRKGVKINRMRNVRMREAEITIREQSIDCLKAINSVKKHSNVSNRDLIGKQQIVEEAAPF